MIKTIQLVVLLSVLSMVSCGNSRFTEVVMAQFENGNPKIVHRTFAKKKAEAHVIEVHFYDNGTLHMEGPLVNGKRHGYWRSWYADGMLWSEGYFEHGQRHRKGIVYHPSGLKQLEGDYENGRKTGVWQSWDETGALISTVDFTLQPD